MNRTRNNSLNSSDRLTANTKRLAEMLDCGRATAVKIGDDAGARIQIGKRVLWNVCKVQEHLNRINTSKTGGVSHGLSEID